MIPEGERGVWVFNGADARFPAGVFTTRELAEAWISKERLSGTLTWYPLDVSVLEWVVAHGHWKPTKAHHGTPAFKQAFSSACTRHEHYEDGVCRTR